MSDVHDKTHVKKARNSCVCEWCGESIYSGTSYTACHGIYEGEPYRTQWHDECIAAVEAEAQRQGLYEYTYEYEKRTRGVCGENDIWMP